MDSSPPCPTNCSITPNQAMNSASVTTNAGMPILDTMKPVRQPITVPTEIASSISIHGLAANPANMITMTTTDSAVPIQIRFNADSTAAITAPAMNA
jgi:hypothetical protein